MSKAAVRGEAISPNYQQVRCQRCQVMCSLALMSKTGYRGKPICLDCQAIIEQNQGCTHKSGWVIVPACCGSSILEKWCKLCGKRDDDFVEVVR